MTYKSPFIVIKEFISPLQCEDIITGLNNTYPDVDHLDNPKKTVRLSKLLEQRILDPVEVILPALEEYYNFETEGILPFKFEWYVEGFHVESARTESFAYTKNKWVRISDISFTGIIFLNDYNDQPPFDVNYETTGGKLEFPNHRFSFNPTRGTLIFFPECPNFVNATSAVLAGELNQIRFHVVAKAPYNYNMNNFPGDYRRWFENLR